MKIKSDFVTNSSSCSFVAWGITMDISDLKAKHGPRIFSLLKAQEQKELDEAAQKRGAFMIVAGSPDIEKLREEYKEFMDNETKDYEIESVFVGLEVESLPESDEIMIGISPFSMEGDQTLNQFKQEICDKLKYVGIEVLPIELQHIEQCWEDR